jgi:SNF2 family DNA or RNA helicase
MITRLINQIKTGSRIATTGSPLSNNLKEYWSMMNWIHEDFLGSIKSFTEDYIEPIKSGLYSDSCAADRKISQKRLLCLKVILDGKILRRDITAIEADLPSKTEFVVYVPLSSLQRQLYEALVNNAGWKHQRYSLFKWINILRLICNHPYTLHVHPPVLRSNNRNISATMKKKQKRKQKRKQMVD